MPSIFVHESTFSALLCVSLLAFRLSGTAFADPESNSAEEFAMRRQLHSATAAAAITFVLCAASFTFVVFVLLPVSAFQAAHVFQVRSVNVQVLNIARATGLVLLLGYGAGVLGWILAFALRRDGMHRLGSMHAVSRR